LEHRECETLTIHKLLMCLALIIRQTASSLKLNSAKVQFRKGEQRAEADETHGHTVHNKTVTSLTNVQVNI